MTDHNERNVSRNDMFIKQILIVFYIILVLLVSFLFKSPLSLIFIGTLPLFLHTLMIYFVDVNRNKAIMRISLVSIIIHLVYLALWKNQVYEILSEMNVPVLFVFNLLLSYTFNAIILYKNFVFKSPDYFKRKYKEYIKKLKQKSSIKVLEIEKEHKEKSKHYRSKIHNLEDELKSVRKYDVTEKNLNVNLRSIEDKFKALNFAIGRVYSNKKGGSAEIRDLIKIDKDLYNSLSDITSNFDASQALVLLNLLERLYRKLLILELPENQVFILASTPKIHVDRDSKGNDPIIDIMSNNDKDPVFEYFSEAKEICVKLIGFLKNTYKIGTDKFLS